MDRVMIERWNAVFGPEEDGYFGDLPVRQSADRVHELHTFASARYFASAA